MIDNNLTEIQMKTLTFVENHINEKKYTPTLKKIAGHFGISIRATYDRIETLRKKGYIKRKKYSRSLNIINVDAKKNNFIPIINEINGNSFLPIKSINNYIPIDKDFFPTGEYFAFKIIDNSMKNTAIKQNDFVIIKMQNYAKNGNIVAVLLEGNIMIRRIFFEEKLIILKSENPEFAMIRKKYVKILGKITGVIRRY